MLPPETLKLSRDEVLTLAVKVVATRVRVFGSAARGDDREKSNQDLLSDRGPEASRFSSCCSYEVRIWRAKLRCERYDGNQESSLNQGKAMHCRLTSKTYGTVAADMQRSMSGLAFVQGLVDGTLPLNTIAKTLGYDITEAESGRVVVAAEPKDIHLNPAGTVHGGLAATMLDSCMGLAIQSTLEKGVGSTTLEFKISFVRPITPEAGLIKAEGTVINRGRRVGTAEGRVTDSKGRLLVHGTTTCLIFESGS